MHITKVIGSLAALSFAQAAQAQAYPFFLDVDICWSQPGNFANRGTQCDPATAPYGATETVFMVEAGGILTQCEVNPGNPGWLYNGGTWSKTNNQVQMGLWGSGYDYLVGALAGGGTSGGVAVGQYGLATPVQSQYAAWDGVKSTQQVWDDCVNGGPPLGNPVEFIDGCDPMWCMDMGPGSGPNGGTLWRYTIPAANFPVGDDVVDPSCSYGPGAGADLVIHMPPVAQIAVDTCQVTPADSAITVYGGDPMGGGYEALCADDDGANFCSQIAPGGGGYSTPGYVAIPAPAPFDPFVVIDEYGAGTYWNQYGYGDRVIDIEWF